MTAFKKILIDIPKDKGIHTKTAGPKKEKYIYKYTKYYRNKNGKPRNKAKNIGKLDPTTGKMHPNNNYYTLYPNNNTQTTPTPPSPQEITVQNYGYTYIINKICQQTNLQTTLTQAFGQQQAQTIIAIAAYMIQEETSTLDNIDDYQQKTFLPNQQTPLTSQTTSHLFTTQTETQRNKFFTNWIKTTLNQGSICYDVTSISSYAKEMTSVERGYNRDNENLPQYNIGLFCDETTKTPLYYNRYNGSLTDKTNLLPVLANAKTVGITHTKLILDGGFWSKPCLVGLQKYCDTFTIGMPMHLKVAQKILADYGEGIEKYQNELVGRHIYCVSVEETVVCGVFGRVFLYFDPLNRYQLCSELSCRVERLKAELACLKRFPKGRLGRYTPYFMLMPHGGDEGFDFMVDAVKVEGLRASKGFFMIFTTDLGVSAGEVLDHYRGKDAVEKLFCQIKVELGGSRVRTHSELATDGKSFVVFVACIIRNYLLNKLLGYLVETSCSLGKALNQLSNIVLLFSQEGGYRFAKALSKKQKDILSVFIESKDLDKTLTDELSTLKP